ncbi:hypothetical protein STENM36S_03785 [Streptomyces tendae]
MQTPTHETGDEGHMSDVVPGRGQYSEEARRQRLSWLRERGGTALASLESTGLAARNLMGNVENFVGSVEVPVGLAGPLLFAGDAARDSVVAPLATTEGALVASTSRGARALTASGGVLTKVLSQRMTRAPVLEFDDLNAAHRFTGWLRERRGLLEEQVRMVSRHTRLIDVEPYQIGRYLHLRCVFETADAAGQNMTTAATWQILRRLTEAVADDEGMRPVNSLLEGNLSGDKKAAVTSLLAGRGTRVTAECRVRRDAVTGVLKTTPEAMVKSHVATVLGAQQAGMVGYGVNAANIVAALFLATGQDAACVHESGTSIFSMETDGDDLVATLLLPNLVVGTVGGGTALPHQRDFLTLLGCAGTGGARRFAEIVAGFALALDVSTMAAVVSGQFAAAHQRLGRARRVDWLQPGDLDAALLQPLLAQGTGDPRLHVTRVTEGPMLRGDGISSELGALAERRKLTGLYPLSVGWNAADGSTGAELVAKVKSRGDEIVGGVAKLFSVCGPELDAAWQRWGADTVFTDAHRLGTGRVPARGARPDGLAAALLRTPGGRRARGVRHPHGTAAPRRWAVGRRPDRPGAACRRRRPRALARPRPGGPGRGLAAPRARSPATGEGTGAVGGAGARCRGRASRTARRPPPGRPARRGRGRRALDAGTARDTPHPGPQRLQPAQPRGEGGEDRGVRLGTGHRRTASAGRRRTAGVHRRPARHGGGGGPLPRRARAGGGLGVAPGGTARRGLRLEAWTPAGAARVPDDPARALRRREHPAGVRVPAEGRGGPRSGCGTSKRPGTVGEVRVALVGIDGTGKNDGAPPPPRTGRRRGRARRAGTREPGQSGHRAVRGAGRRLLRGRRGGPRPAQGLCPVPPAVSVRSGGAARGGRRPDRPRRPAPARRPSGLPAPVRPRPAGGRAPYRRGRLVAQAGPGRRTRGARLAADPHRGHGRLGGGHGGTALGRPSPDVLSTTLARHFGVTLPDGLLLLDLPVSEALRRTGERPRGGELHETEAFLAATRERYDAVLGHLSRTRPRLAVRRLHCSGRSVDEVAAEVRDAVANLSS